MRIIALDPATNTGICDGEVGKTPVLSARRLREHKDEPIEDVFGRATFFLADLLRTRAPDAVAIEAPIWVTDERTNHHTLTLTRGLYAIFAGIVKAKGITLLTAEVATWRKYVLDHGRLPGDAAKRECLRVCARLGWHAPSHDAAEAAGIWLWACAKLDPRNARRHEPLFARRAA